MRKIARIALILTGMLILFTGCTFVSSGSYFDDGPDPLVTPGTAEYMRYTSRLLGTWEVVAAEHYGRNLYAEVNESITVTISLEPRLMTMEFFPQQAYVDRRLEDWVEKDSSLFVDRYARTISWDWWEPAESSFAYDLDYIDVDRAEVENSLVVTGKGSSLETFAAWEQFTSALVGLQWLPSRWLVEIIDNDTIRLFSYEKKGIVHWNRGTLTTDMLLKRIR